VGSGIALTKGDLWGRGDFGWHYRFVWPAFGLLVALAVGQQWTAEEMWAPFPALTNLLVVVLLLSWNPFSSSA
jgi:hypothetical protein